MGFLTRFVGGNACWSLSSAQRLGIVATEQRRTRVSEEKAGVTVGVRGKRESVRYRLR